ncbi:hypothetical protein ACFL2T_05030 [Elusimicrobiota bacterium]
MFERLAHGAITSTALLLAAQFLYAHSALGPALRTLGDHGDLVREMTQKRSRPPDPLSDLANGVKRPSVSPDLQARLALARRMLGAERSAAPAPRSLALSPSAVRIEQAMLELLSSSPPAQRLILACYDRESARRGLGALAAAARRLSSKTGS